MIDDRTIQGFLARAGHYRDIVDGNYGRNSQDAAKVYLLAKGHPEAAAWPAGRCKVAIQQCIMAEGGIEVGTVDGLVGPQFRHAIEEWQNRSRDQEPDDAAVAHQPSIFPRQREVPTYFGESGSGLGLLQLPYPMVLAWDTKQSVNRVTLHTKVHASASRAFKRILDHYGYDQIKALGLDKFGGSYVKRAMRGGTNLSMHSWGIAMDFDPERNQLRWGRDKARMARPEYGAFLDAWQQEGWISLGRERNFDWMHVQAARL
jgi:hypothetical protein